MGACAGGELLAAHVCETPLPARYAAAFHPARFDDPGYLDAFASEGDAGHGRIVARVFSGNRDVNAEMVRRGFAWVRHVCETRRCGIAEVPRRLRFIRHGSEDQGKGREARAVGEGPAGSAVDLAIEVGAQARIPS